EGFGMYHMSNAYNLFGVDVSSDGQVVAAAGSGDCVDNPHAYRCTKLERDLTTITMGGHSQDYAGNLRLSANGKWAFGVGSGLFLMPPYRYLVNLAGEQSPSLPSLPLTTLSIDVTSSGRIVANDGTVVYIESGGVVIVQGGRTLRILPQPGEGVFDAVIDAGA